MSSHDELIAALGEELCAEMSRVADVVLSPRPQRSAVIAELTAVVATHREVRDATIDDRDVAHIVLEGSTTLHATIDRGVVGMLVDPALQFHLGGFWEEGDGWTLGWQSADGTVFVQTTVPAVHVTRPDHHTH